MPGIIVGPKTLTRGFARFATFRLAAIGLGPGVAIVREEELFATPAQPFSDALHDPVPPGQKCNIRNRKGSRGLNAGRRQKNDGIVSDYEEKDRPGRRPCSRRRRRYNFRLSVTLCGYDTMSWLAQKLKITLPSGVDGTKPGYALFTWSSVASLINLQWLQSPTRLGSELPRV